MSQYKAPLRDIRFVMDELLETTAFYESTEKWNEVSSELVGAIGEECAKFCENVLSPLNAVGDSEGCTLKDGQVYTPTGFKEAYQQYVDGGWPALSAPEDMGGQNLPGAVAIMKTEMTGTANWAWGMYPGLSQGAIHTVEAHGTDSQKSVYLTKLVSGQWTGTMCLTESHCGSDLGMLRTKAEPNADGSYNITGTKIFISSGDHDMAENIVHIVLARLPGAPEGTKGISLFIVPKVLPNDAGEIGEKNTLECGSLEEKMGIHGNSTCVMNFDAAKGFLIGEENRGLNAMFTFMNTARIGTAAQGLAHAECAYQNSLTYAQERLQMRALSGPKNPDGPADPIIVHPDVRRMLLTQKAFSEGSRMLLYYATFLGDQNSVADEEESQRLEDTLALLTPVAKAFMTETGFEAANLGMQVFGGHGYIKEWGMEQNVRDARISMIYEGTTGIQALDLLGRKILQTQGRTLKVFGKEISQFCAQNEHNPAVAEMIKKLKELLEEWSNLTFEIGAKALENPDEIGAASVDYLMFSGYVTYAYLWARAALVAQRALDNGSTETDYYQSKLFTAQFYYQRILPRTSTLRETMLSGIENLDSANVDPFINIQ
ncbi:MAG: acyl-CoA dehydrogenase C-terminal domain-containing protein [Pseudomonadales bacterium]